MSDQTKNSQGVVDWEKEVVHCNSDIWKDRKSDVCVVRVAVMCVRRQIF